MGCLLFNHSTPYSWHEAEDWCKKRYSLPCAYPVDHQGFSTGFSTALLFFTYAYCLHMPIKNDTVDKHYCKKIIC